MHTDTRAGIAMFPQAQSQALVHAACGVCGADDPDPVAVGADFSASRKSDETFLMVRCRACTLLYLNPRPPASVCAEATPRTSGGLRRWLAARRFGVWCRALAPNARVLNVSFATDFRLERMRAFARTRGLTVNHATAGELTLDVASYDLIVVAETIERVADPAAFLATIRTALRPGGRLIITTENAGALGRRLFGARYWSGYNFPRHASVFTQTTLARLAVRSGFRVIKIATTVKAASWTRSIYNVLFDMRAPRWVVARFGADARTQLVLFAALDALASYAGRGGLLRATLELPAS